MPENLFFHYPRDWNEIQHLSVTDMGTASFNKSGEPSLTWDANPTHNGHPETQRLTEMQSIYSGPGKGFQWLADEFELMDQEGWGGIGGRMES